MAPAPPAAQRPRPPPPSPPPPDRGRPRAPRPSRRAAGDALVALVAGRRRTTGCAWERAARRHLHHHPSPSPPPAWHALNAAVVTGRASPASAFRGALAGDPVPVPAAPSLDGLLAPRPAGRRFADPALARYIASLFVATVLGRRRHPAAPSVSLCRHDLFHGHLLYAPAAAGFALLMHAAEYPRYDEAMFPYHLGTGQADSPLTASPATLAHRNVLAAGGRLATLDASPASPIADRLLWPDLAAVATLCESDLGVWVGDVTYFVQSGVRGGARVLAYEGPEDG